jgi:hypothetical protein
MPRTKKATSFEPPVSRRERELLDNLALLKSQGKKTTVVAFARDNGYANKSALRHFPVLRRELSEYVAQCSATPQSPPGSLKAKYVNAQIERQAREIERLKKQTKAIPPLKARIAKLESDKKHDAHQKKLLRGMLSTVISFLSSSDFAKARDLSARLEMQAKALKEDNEDDPSSSDK